MHSIFPVQTASNSSAGFASLRSEQPGDLLPVNYEPTELDICSGRGKRNWNHAGNVAFRNLIQSQVEPYIAAKSKNAKTAIVLKILDDLRNQGYHFLKANKEGRWFDMGDAQARDKIGHGLRDQVTAINRQNKEQQQLGQQQHVRRPSITLSDSGNEAVHRKSTVNTAHHFVEFARRPSWIAGESSSSSELVESGKLSALQGLDAERERGSSWDFLDHLMDHYSNSVIDMSAATTKTQEESRIEPMDVSPSDLMKNSSILSFDPRMSEASSVFMNSARATSGGRDNSMRGSVGSGRDQTMRVSGGSTLRQMTNSLRVSDMSDMTGLLDPDHFESV